MANHKLRYNWIALMNVNHEIRIRKKISFHFPSFFADNQGRLYSFLTSQNVRKVCFFLVFFSVFDSEF